MAQTKSRNVIYERPHPDTFIKYFVQKPIICICQQYIA